MAEVIAFEEVSSVFSLNKIWAGEHEFPWYHWCWETLEKNGLTKYNSGYEKALVYVRAYTLFFIYAELCDYFANECFTYEVEPDDDFLPASWLGYILAKTNDYISGDHDLYDMDEYEMLSLCVDTQRASVSKALMDVSNLHDALIMFIHAAFDVPLATDWDEYYDKLSVKEEMALDWLHRGAFRRELLEYKLWS